MWRRQNRAAPESQLKAEDAIVSTLRGGESLPAWNAIWDLVQSSDSHAKQDLLLALRDYVAHATATDESVALAQTFESALKQSLAPTRKSSQVLPSREVRAHFEREQVTASRKAMEQIGVRPGEGLPMWAMYMTRRSKRSWG